MIHFFKELFEYSHHYNQKLADIFITHTDKTNEKAVKLFNHIINAHNIWNNRIEPKQTTIGVWELNPLQDLKSIDKTNYEQTLQILEKYHLNEIISYSNSRGQSFNNRTQDILFHIVNHATHHRGQIATEFKRQGLEPPVTDYIFYKRENY